MLGAAPMASAILWTIALIVLSVVAIAALFVIKRWALGSASSSASTLTLAELRGMAERGEISPAEYERARAAAIRAAGGDASLAGKGAGAIDGATLKSESSFSGRAGSSEEHSRGTGAAWPANRRNERKPPPGPIPGQESGGPDR